MEAKNNSAKRNEGSNKRLSTNTLSSGNRVQRWANFIAGFSIEFVEECLTGKDPETDIVFDPFLGCGTTLIGARNLGFSGLGVEAHPLFYMLSKAKDGNYCKDDIVRIRTILLAQEQRMEWSAAAMTFIEKMFAPDDIELMQYASSQLSNVDEDLRPLATAIFLKACELSCNAQTDGIYKAPESKKKSVAFRLAVDAAAVLFVEDVESEWYIQHWTKKNSGSILHKSSTSLPEIENNSLSICITSPPYLNNFDYAEMTRLQLYLLGWADSWGDISEKVRNNLITNTTTALKGKKSAAYQDHCRSMLPNLLRTELSEIVLDLQIQRLSRRGKKEYDYLVYPYYMQIRSVLTELYHKLRVGGEINWVVADAALYGVHIKTHQHTKVLMEEIGYQEIKINWMRKRGHRWILSKRDGAKEALGEYHITAKKL